MASFLKKAVSAIPVVAGAKYLLGATKSQSPSLPGVPDPYLYDDVPDFTPEEIQYIQQRRKQIEQYANKLNQAPGAYENTNDELAALEQQRYKAALQQQQGQLSVAQQQQRLKEFQAFKEAAGRRGIRILGDDPSTATSNSTAGIQQLQAFNQRYDALADQQRRADLEFGYSANTGRLGLINQGKQAYFNNSAVLDQLYGGMQDIYGAQRAAKYNRANANTDIRNQFLNNTYNRNANQAILDTSAYNQTNANRLGLISTGLSAAATLLGGGAGGAAGAARAGGAVPQGYAPYNYNNRLSLYGGQSYA